MKAISFSDTEIGIAVCMVYIFGYVHGRFAQWIDKLGRKK